MFSKACKLVLVSIPLCLCLSLATTQQQGSGILYPIGHTIPAEVQAVNGSQDNVGCNGTQLTSFVCLDLDPGTPGGATSYLVDRNIPTSLDFSDDNWARELMTVNHNGQKDFFDIRITFNAVCATRVELVLFNCPDWGIAAVDITVETTVTSTVNGTIQGIQEVVGNITLQTTSCDSLLTACIPLQSPGLSPAAFYIVNFLTGSTQNIAWTHIAEVTFYDDSIECADPFLVTAAPTEPTGVPSTELPTSTDIQTTTSSTTTSTSDPSGVGTGAQNTIIIIVVVIVVAIIVLIVIPLTIFLCCYLAMRKRKHGIHEVEKLQSVLLEHKSLELSTIKQAQEDTNNTYDYAAVPSKSRHTWSGGKSHEVNSNEPVHVYSTVAKDEHDTHKATEEGTYATLRDDEYAVVDKPPPPIIPEKSDDLQIYLETKTASQDFSSNGQQAERPQLAQISKPIGGEMLSNLSYDTIGFNGEKATPSPREVSLASDNVYAEPDRPVNRGVPMIKPGGSPVTDNVYAELDENDGHILTQQAIYEEVYSEPIKPSLFMQKQVISEATEDDLQPYGPIYTVPTAPAENMPVEVTSKNIRFDQELGDGHFGKVILARTVGLSSKDLKLGNSDDKKNVSFLVAVKTLKPSASTANRLAFEKEYKFMSRLDHNNVIRILGICTSGDTPFLMMEYMEKGDLNQYLQEYTEIIDSSNTLSDGQISTSTLLSMCIQIASAMKYLAARNFVHRDLATRNCLVSDNNVIKIADFGMSRNLYDSHYYVIQGHAILPVRWMATECFYGLFSAKTDVWAFGVTMWEIFTLAKDEPYGDVTDQEIVQDAIKGEERTILEKPEACPQDVYDVMLRCWVHNSTDRATFEEAFVNLSAVNSQ